MSRILLLLVLTTPPALAEGRCEELGRAAESAMQAREDGFSERELLSVAGNSLVAQEIVRLAFSLPEGASPEQFGEDIETVCRRGG